ncbi:MAG: hypothetical protein FWE95_02560 [Planctomycetaceae bacterium]|nr:hypothetical protein [Planctomycetaceae bacterium]
MGASQVTIKTLLQRIAVLEQTISTLQDANRSLRAQLAQQRRTSARQAGPFRRRDSKKVPQDQQKRPGQKPGHPGTNRPVPEHIDQEIEKPLDGCPKCGGPVSECHPVEQFIEEIPPVHPRVVRLITWEGLCPHCGEVHSTHPLQTSRARHAAKVQLGPRALAIVCGNSVRI